MTRIQHIVGSGVPVPGRDIDTDRIIPARFLRSVTFEGLEAGVFADDRASTRAAGGMHPFDDPRYRAAAVLIVQSNFGCGSSREHAPQALYRWGIRAIVGESFGEIFFGNALAIGLPCVTATRDAIDRLRRHCEQVPAARLTIDLEDRTLTAPEISAAIMQPDAARDAFLSGQGDSTGLLMEDPSAIARTVAALPYLNGY